MAVELINFGRLLPANGPINWGDHLGEAMAAPDAWQVLSAQPHIIDSGGQAVAHIIATPDGRGLVTLLGHAGNMIDSSGVTPVYTAIERLRMGPGPDETRVFPLLAVPRGRQAASLGEICVTGILRWRPDNTLSS